VFIGVSAPGGASRNGATGPPDAGAEAVRSSAFVGLSVRDPETAQSAGVVFLPLAVRAHRRAWPLDLPRS
jgi:hypothetical protein